MEAGYIGNRGRKLTTWQPANYSVWQAGATDSAQSIRDRRIFAAYSNDLRTFSSRLDSSYDALQLRSTMRMKSLTGEVSYLFGKTLSPFGNRTSGWETVYDTGGGATYPERIDLDKAIISPLHTFRANFVYDLPLFLNGGGALPRLLGGWSVSSAFQAASGGWGTVTWGLDANADGQPNDRPSQIGPIVYGTGTKDQRRDSYFTNPKSSFGSPCANGNYCETPGTLGRNAIQLPGSFFLDSAIMKNFRITEGVGAQFRVDIRNLTNTSFLQTPDLNFNRGNNVNFGRSFGFSHVPRTIQMGFRVNF